MPICRRQPSTCFAHKVMGPSVFALVGGCMCGSVIFARGLTRWRAKSQPESPSKTPVSSNIGRRVACQFSDDGTGEVEAMQHDEKRRLSGLYTRACRDLGATSAWQAPPALR